jgi:hypothetical protein
MEGEIAGQTCYLASPSLPELFAASLYLVNETIETVTKAIGRKIKIGVAKYNG